MTSFDPRTEKNLATLLPQVAAVARVFMARAIARLATEGLTVRIISGTRTFAEQDVLYAKGRTTAGPKVTNARGGYSNHNFGVAFDIGVFRLKGRGDYLGESPHYHTLGPIGEAAGLLWGGRWKSFKDEPHYEFPTGLTLAQMRQRLKQGKPIL